MVKCINTHTHRSDEKLQSLSPPKKRDLKRKTGDTYLSLGSSYIAFASRYLHSQSPSPLSKNMLWLQAVFIKQMTPIACYNILPKGNKSEVQRGKEKRKRKTKNPSKINCFLSSWTKKHLQSIHN